jgi:hypothetical protein
MSTPAGKQFDPIDLSAYASQRARDRAVTQQHPPERDSSPIASPYAPKRVRGASGVNPRAVEDTADPPPAAHTPQTGRAPPVEEATAAASDETHPLPHFLVSTESRTETEWARPAEPVESPPVAAEVSATDATETADPDWFNFGAEPRVNDDAAPSLQPPDASITPHHDQPSANPAEPSDSDRDLERLEASLHWLQRAGSSARLPRAASLTPVPGFPAADGARRRYSAELIARGGRPRSLEPERMAPPPVSSRSDKLRLATYIVVPSIVVGAVSYYLASGGWAPQPQPTARSQAVAYEPMLTPQATSGDVGQEHSPIADSQSDFQASPNEKSPGPAEISRAEKSAELPAATSVELPATKLVELPAEKPAELPAEKPLERQAMAVPQPAETAPPPVPAPAPSTPVRQLDPEEIKILLKRGDHFIASGDLVTARMVFRRAAEVGDATAAIALGATYDPGVLARLGVVGMGAADVEKARHWYQKAESLGSSEASRRLQLLAAR